ncbi:MAG: energy transducer TonB [Thermodesulfobacteriota bacterium]
MLRLLSGLLVALICHGLFLLLPLSFNRATPPRLQGDEPIRISLSAAVQDKTKAKERAAEAEEDEEAPVIMAAEEEVEPLPQVEEITPQTSEPVPGPVAPLSLKPLSRKKRIPQKTFKHSEQTDKTLPSRKSSPPAVSLTELPEESGAPAMVKATPLYSRNPKPEYPPLARRRNYQGTVLLSLLVSAQGDVSRVTLQRSSGHVLLDKSAIRTVKNWRFLPGTDDGRPVPMEVLIPIHFRLTE